jgi:hypothetical protein
MAWSVLNTEQSGWTPLNSNHFLRFLRKGRE